MNQPTDHELLSGTQPTPSQMTGNMLLVDDEPEVLYTLKSILERAGHICWTASSGEEALELLEVLRFDVIVVDLTMPGLSGKDVLEQIKERDFPVVSIILTGFGDVESAVECMRLGAFDFLSKPISVELLEHAVLKALKHAESLRRERCVAKIAQDWEATFDASIDLLAVLDHQGKVIRCNRAMLNRLEISAEKLYGRNFSEIFQRGTNAPGYQILKQAIQLKRPCSVELNSESLRGSFLITAAPYFDVFHAVSGIVYQARDLTELKRIERDRSHLLRRLFSIQEEERKRISRDLHDSIGQSMMSLVLGLNNLQAVTDPADIQSGMNDLIRLAGNTLNEVRTLSRGLRPTELDDLGLLPALEQLLSNIQNVTSLEVDFCYPDSLRPLSRDVQTAIFRIVQEAMSNVGKHANAKTVSVILVDEGNRIRLVIEDDGQGFDPDHVQQGRTEGCHLGLISIRERLAPLGGNYQIESQRNSGTSLYITIPLEEPTHVDDPCHRSG